MYATKTWLFLTLNRTDLLKRYIKNSSWPTSKSEQLFGKDRKLIMDTARSEKNIYFFCSHLKDEISVITCHSATLNSNKKTINTQRHCYKKFVFYPSMRYHKYLIKVHQLACLTQRISIF